MTSQELKHLRDLPKAQAAALKAYREQRSAFKSQGFAVVGSKATARRQDLIDHSVSTNTQILESARQHIEGIRQRAAKRKVASTPESVAKVEKMLSTGWSFTDMLEQLVKENDRAGMAAVVESLPYLARANKLPISGTTKDFHKVEKHAQEIISQFEPHMWDDGEKALQAELREVAMYEKMMQQNAHVISEEMRGFGVVGQLYNWGGLPNNQDGLEQGLMDVSPAARRGDLIHG